MSISYKSLFPSSPTPVEDFPYPEAQGNGSACGVAPEDVDGGDEVAQLLLRAHAEGVREGEGRERLRAQEMVAQERTKIMETILHFQTSVAEYFSRTELEVVRLALAIAAKILHREAQADPLLLGKLANAVLSKLHQNTRVKVRVPSDQIEAWRGELAFHQDGKTVLEVIADTAMQPQSCILETELGTAEVGIAAQLREVENGLFDLLAETPEQR